VSSRKRRCQVFSSFLVRNMLRCLQFFFIAVVSAIHIDRQGSDGTVQHGGQSKQAVAATYKNKKVRRSMTMAGSLAVLSRKVTQEPAAEEKSGVEVDEEGYKKDWQKEFRDEPYPKESEGLQQHPDFGETKAPALRYEALKYNLVHSWWPWVLLILIIALVAGLAFYFYKGKSS